MVLPPSFNSYSEYFNECLAFLQENEWIFNFPVTEIFVRDVTSQIPYTWVPPLSNLSEDELNLFPSGFVEENGCWPWSLIRFCKSSKKLKLEPTVFNSTNKLELHELIKDGVTPKKTHEVENFVPFIHSLCKEKNINKIVDIGSGLGYLDLFLYLKYNYKILGVETRKKLVETARQRYEKLRSSLPPEHAGEIKYVEKHVVSYFSGTMDILCDEINSYFSENSTIKKAITNLSDEKSMGINPVDTISSNVETEESYMNVADRYFNLCQKNFGEKLFLNDSLCYESKEVGTSVQKENETGDICLTGLHTCGDLFVDSLNLFMALDDCKLCILLGCCYHMARTQQLPKIFCPDPPKYMYPRPKPVSFKGFPLLANPRRLQGVSYKIPPGLESFKYFPLSVSLKKLVSDFPAASFFLQHTFLRLAANETSIRWFSMSAENRRSQLFHTLARGVIQLYLHQNEYMVKKNKRRCVTKVPDNDFNSYLTCFLSRCEISKNCGGIIEIIEIKPHMIESITKLWEEMKSKESLVQIVLCLQATVQFVAESLVVIDRVKYLEENNAKHVDVVRVLDDYISPRSLAICVQK